MFDVVIRGCRVIDGSGSEAFHADVALEGDRIAELAQQAGCLKYGPVDAGPIVGYIVMLRDPSGNTCEFSHGQSIQGRERREPGGSAA